MPSASKLRQAQAGPSAWEDADSGRTPLEEGKGATCTPGLGPNSGSKCKGVFYAGPRKTKGDFSGSTGPALYRSARLRGTRAWGLPAAVPRVPPPESTRLLRSSRVRASYHSSPNALTRAAVIRAPRSPAPGAGVTRRGRDLAGEG
jgi:hypothetical protein